MILKPSFSKALIRSSIFLIGIPFICFLFWEQNKMENFFLICIFIIFAIIPLVMRHQNKIILNDGFLIGNGKKIPVNELEEIIYKKHMKNMHLGTRVLVETIVFKSIYEEIVIHKLRYTVKEVENFISHCLEQNENLIVREENLQ